MTDLKSRILSMAHLRSTHIADSLGCSARYARRILKQHGVEHRVGPPNGEDNPSWRGGRMVDLDGYVLLQTCPTRLLEHRFVMAKILGRPLLQKEVVDHINGITIHNDPSNLRLFSTNGDHLQSTITGFAKNFSVSGHRNILAQKKNLVGQVLEPVDIYYLRKKRGDVRLRAILRAALELGTTHPCLSGTTHWLTQIGIDPSSHPSLKRAWDKLEIRYAEDLGR